MCTVRISEIIIIIIICFGESLSLVKRKKEEKKVQPPSPSVYTRALLPSIPLQPLSKRSLVLMAETLNYRIIRRFRGVWWVVVEVEVEMEGKIPGWFGGWFLFYRALQKVCNSIPSRNSLFRKARV